MIKSRHSVWVLLFVLAGCVSTGPVPEDRFYQLEIEGAPVNAGPPVFRGVLRVDHVTADPLRSGRAVLYRDTSKPLELQRYHYEFWVDQPPRMVQQALVQYLRQSGIADSVQDGSQRTEADYRLRTRLQQFEQVVGSGRPKVAVELEAILYSRRSGSVIWTNSYQRRQESGATDIHATALAMQKALENIFHAVLADLRALGPKT